MSTGHKQAILAALRRNTEVYGKPYCPCIPSYIYTQPGNLDYVCPCKEYREKKVCMCGLYTDIPGKP